MSNKTQPAYDATVDALRVMEVAPAQDDYLYDEFFKDVAVAADPGSTDTVEVVHDGKSDLLIQLWMLGGQQTGPSDATVTVLIYGTAGMDASDGSGGTDPQYVDVTKRFLDCNANSNNTSYTAAGTTGVSYLLEWPRCPLQKFKINYDWDAAPSVTNGELIAGYRHKAL